MAEEESEIEKYRRLYEEQRTKVKELERQNSQLKVKNRNCCVLYHHRSSRCLRTACSCPQGIDMCGSMKEIGILVKKELIASFPFRMVHRPWLDAYPRSPGSQKKDSWRHFSIRAASGLCTSSTARYALTALAQTVLYCLPLCLRCVHVTLLTLHCDTIRRSPS